MLIKPQGKITWTASASTDVVAYIVYQEDGMPVGYDSPSVNVGNQTSVDLPLAGLPEVESDDVNIGVAAVDHIGNLSDITQIVTSIDVTAPDAPTNLQHVQSE